MCAARAQAACKAMILVGGGDHLVTERVIFKDNLRLDGAVYDETKNFRPLSVHDMVSIGDICHCASWNFASMKSYSRSRGRLDIDRR